ncbi:ANKL1 protein, partial [Eolophus roseicapillus]|nr:ANKL1 protein [Eolophus roseicapilla]
PDPGGPRRSLSFLTEDATEGSICPALPEAGSLLQEPGGCSGLRGLLPSLSIPSFAPWHQGDPGDSALPLHPLASSTLLSDGDEGTDVCSGDREKTGCLGDTVLVPGAPSSSLGSSPTVLLVPGDHWHPQCPPSDAQGSPCAAFRVLEGGSGCQNPSSLGTPQPLWLHRRFCRLLAPRALAVPPCTQEQECEEWGRAPTKRHSPGHEDTAQLRPLSDEGLRRHLQALGDEPGPLAAALQSGLIPDCAQDELVLRQEFDCPDRSRHWRGGLVKSSFNYLLLDPRTTQNLPLRSHRLSPAECFRTFVQAIFYVGKGTRTRPYCHLAEALGQHRTGTRKGCPKVRRILEIWESGHGVVSVHCFQSTVPAEAYTREGCLVEALGLQTITNQRKGLCYGAVAHWPAARRRRLGVHMLHRAMSIFLAEGERQLRPVDIQGR